MPRVSRVGHRERDLQDREEIDDFKRLAELRLPSPGCLCSAPLPVVGRDSRMPGVKAMTRLTRDDIIKAVGEIDDTTIAEIIATGATAEELAEAQAWINNDEPLMNAGRPLPSGRVGELVAILEELELDEDDEESGPVPGEV
jgi:hypothetical protein